MLITATIVRTDGSHVIGVGRIPLFNRTVRTVGTDYTVTSEDFEILADSSTGPFTISLPPATASGLTIHIGKIGGTDDVITVQADGTDTIQGSDQIALVDNFSDCWLIDAATGYWDNPGS